MQQSSKKFGNVKLSPTALMLFALSLGPLGLPLLWFSDKYSTRTKILVSVSVIGGTVVLPMLIIVYWLNVALQPLLEVF
jgi:hypothetical protein